jgi:hypothetical protein
MFRAILMKKYKIYHINDILVKMKLGGASTQSLKSFILITKEVWRSFDKNKINFNRTRYLYGKLKKALKQIQL